MGELLATNQSSIIFGYGVTGKSVARYLDACGENFMVVDTREAVALKQDFSKQFPGRRMLLGEPDLALIHSAGRVILSPGIPRTTPFVMAALDMGLEVIGDIALFLSEVQKPVIGVTGSNGKSTVVTLLGKVLERAGKRVAVGGNIGTPALDLLNDNADVYILELSSFQLESLKGFGLHTACLLNVTPDHMDRYETLQDYCMTKHRIFGSANTVVFNQDDLLTVPPIIEGVKRASFAMEHSEVQGGKHFWFDRQSAHIMCNNVALFDTADLNMLGEHNLANAIAVCALVDSIGVDPSLVGAELGSFKGLPHRCEWVADIDGVTFINDSKGTNVGASIAAIEGVRRQFSALTVIAGGEGKNASFDQLGDVIGKYVKALVVIGRDGGKILDSVKEKSVAIFAAQSMAEAVALASAQAQPGEAVLLSPACASFDMFDNYQDRGDVFKEAVAIL